MVLYNRPECIKSQPFEMHDSLNPVHTHKQMHSPDV